MIISASYKTDIPAFYGEWFMNRLNAGYCKVVNHFNQKIYRVSLKREDVDGIVFWTKNLGPFLNHLEKVKKLGYSFIIQYTINGYPRTLESSVVDSTRSISHMRLIADRYGPKVGVWRYDTIIISSLTPIDFHLSNFESIAKALENSTDEVVISFAQIYKKTLKNMNWASKKYNFTWCDPNNDTKIQLAGELSKIASSRGMRLSMCSQPQLLSAGVDEARCIDVRRLSEISKTFILAKLKGSRPSCGCYYSKDIGEYDTCPHGCIYCYAVLDRELAQKRYKEHNASSEFLFQPPNGYIEEDPRDKSQLSLF